MGDVAASTGGVGLAGDRFLPLAFGDAAGGVLPKLPKGPKDPDNLFEKLLLRLCDVLLDAVDCDHRLRLLTLSSPPCLLPDPVYKALDRLFCSGDLFLTSGESDRCVKSGVFIVDLLVAPGGRRPVGTGLGVEPFLEVNELALCTVVADDPEAEFGREFWYGMTGFCSVEVITIMVRRFGKSCSACCPPQGAYPWSVVEVESSIQGDVLVSTMKRVCFFLY